MKNFTSGVKTPFRGLVKSMEITTKEGKKTFSYLPWVRGLALADRPRLTVRMYGMQPFLEVFGGAVVTVDQALPDGTIQSTHLPILNGANQPRPVAKITSRDVGDTISRCRAKSVAMVNGVGLSLYAHNDALQDTIKFIKALKVTPNSDLNDVEPLIAKSDEKNGEYIDWPTALAAVRITDPNFHWQVESFETADSNGELRSFPAMRAGTGWCVAVKVRYRAVEHTEILPIMGFREVTTKRGLKNLDHQPLVNPNVHDWNRAVMRCLTKAISIASGYGINVYARESVEAMHVDPVERKVPESTDSQAPAPAPTGNQGQSDSAPTAADAIDSQEMPDNVRHACVERINKALASAGKSADSLLIWLGCKDGDIASLSSEQLVRASKALNVDPPAPASVH